MSDTELPGLGDETESTIVPDNIRAAGAIYFASNLEQLKLFHVADRLVNLFQNGLVSISTKSAGRNLYQYWRQTPLRLSDKDRRNLYTRVVGLPGGDGDVVPNRDFNDLWIRFIASVSAFARQDATNVEAQSAAEVTARKAGRELAQNLSVHGHGIALFAATELSRQAEQVLSLLRDKDIQQAYGARDVWQVVDEVAKHDLGGAVSVIHYRTMATAGATIINWLANNARKFSPSNRGKFLSGKLASSGRVLGVTGSKRPSDADLVNACEQWLAVAGSTDQPSTP